MPPQLAGLAGNPGLPPGMPASLPSLAAGGGGGGRDGSPRDAAGTSAFADAAQLPTNGSGGAPSAATPFAAAGGGMPPPAPMAGRAPEPAGPAPGGPAGGPSAALSLAGLSGLFGGDLSRLPQLAGLANFPSIPPVRLAGLVGCASVRRLGLRKQTTFAEACCLPFADACCKLPVMALLPFSSPPFPLQGMMSGDLEQLLMAQGSLPDGAASLFAAGRAPSFNIGKLESLNLPDEALAAAMLQMERAGMAPGPSLPAPRQAQQGAAPVAAAAAGQSEPQQAQQQGGGEGQQQAQQGQPKLPAKDAATANNNAGGGSEVRAMNGADGQRLTPAKRKA